MQCAVRNVAPQAPAGKGHPMLQPLLLPMEQNCVKLDLNSDSGFVYFAVAGWSHWSEQVTLRTRGDRDGPVALLRVML
jgi:hypothetical protein